MDELETKRRTEALVATLCHGFGVHTEITNMISKLISPNDIRKLGCVSRQLHDWAESITYREITLDFTDCARTGARAVLLLRTLLASDSAGGNIERLSLSGDPLADWRRGLFGHNESVEHAVKLTDVRRVLVPLQSFTSDEFSRFSGNLELLGIRDTLSDQDLSLPGLCCGIIQCASSLQDLQVSSDYFRFREFRDGLRSIARLGHLDGLRTADLCTDIMRGFRHMIAIEEWDEILLQVFSASQVQQLKTLTAMHPGRLDLSPMSALTCLVLDHHQCHDYDLKALFMATPALRHLEYTAWIDYNSLPSFIYGRRPPELHHRVPEGSLGLDRLFESLELVRVSLCTLITSVWITEDSPHFQEEYGSGFEPRFDISKGLAHLDALETLMIPYY